MSLLAILGAIWGVSTLLVLALAAAAARGDRQMKAGRQLARQSVRPPL